MTNTYTYDSDGFKNVENVGGSLSTIIWDGTDYLQVRGQSTIKTFHTVESQMMSYIESTLRYDFLTDNLGSITAIMDGSQIRVWDTRYSAYGRNLWSTGTNCGFGWVGSYGYRETGLFHMSHYVRARHYSYLTGGWSTVDPLWPDESAYGYVGGRVGKHIDPSGLSECGNPDECDPADFCARNWTYDMNAGGGPRFATVLCCKGKKITCVWPKPSWWNPKDRRRPPLPNADVVECLKKHEDRHHQDCKCKGGLECVVPSEKYLPSECAAHAIDIPCFQSKLDACLKRAFGSIEIAACVGYYGWWIRNSCKNMRLYNCPNIPKECNKR